MAPGRDHNRLAPSCRRASIHTVTTVCPRLDGRDHNRIASSWHHRVRGSVGRFIDGDVRGGGGGGVLCLSSLQGRRGVSEEVAARCGCGLGGGGKCIPAVSGPLGLALPGEVKDPSSRDRFEPTPRHGTSSSLAATVEAAAIPTSASSISDSTQTNGSTAKRF